VPRRVLAGLLAAFGLGLLGPAARPAPDDVVPGHRLPEGVLHPVREREIDVQRLVADLRIDLDRETLEGEVTQTFSPLRSGLARLSLDAAASVEVTEVELLGHPGPLSFARRGPAIEVVLPRPLAPDDTEQLRVRYSCRSTRSGLYFFPRSAQGGPQAWTYGEGGRHYTWLPLYNDTNERFAVEMRLTVARPYVALSNGTLAETRENADGTRTFVWRQEQPIPNYLLTVDVGEFTSRKLDEARVADRLVPLAAWAAPGREEAAAYAFRDTPRMVEYFSRRFAYPYPWPKYDQIALREFAIGAMETTGMVGFAESHLHLSGDPPDSAPALDEAWPTWTYEDTISHELAHHWFGDLVTCRSLGSIFLNESFASFSHTLWNEHAHGPDDAAYQRWVYLDRYLSYVQRTGQVRPLEYFRYRSPGDVYQEETTYVKGALVLQSLRHLLGDDDFFRGLSAYLKRNQFGSVEARDLQVALEGASGRDLSSFFGDWIVEGGGHPVLEVEQHYSPERRALDLTVRQVQADLPFENAFTIPVDVEIATASSTRTETVALTGWTTQVALAADSAPLYVAFDKGGWLVAEVAQPRALAEVRAQLERGGVAEQLRAARQLASDFKDRPEAAAALVQVLGAASAHWGLRQEAARGLGAIGGPEATAALTSALGDPDRRVRRAAALALGEVGPGEATEALRRTVRSDPAEDVVGVAERSLGRSHAPGAAAFLEAQLGRTSRWWDTIRLGSLLGLAEVQDPALVPLFRRYLEPVYNREVRLAALDGWARAAPADDALATRCRDLTADRNPAVREAAVRQLGRMHRSDDLGFLRRLASSEADPDLAEAARSAAGEIESFTPTASR
jgi:aminopeptidase N